MSEPKAEQKAEQFTPEKWGWTPAWLGWEQKQKKLLLSKRDDGKWLMKQIQDCSAYAHSYPRTIYLGKLNDQVYPQIKKLLEI